MPSPSHAAPSPGRQSALTPVLLSLAMLVAIISSLGAPLIPTIAEVDGVSVAGAQWSLTVTMLVGAVATPAMGRLGDGPHRRRVILIGLAVVLVGSVLAALPLGFAWLIVGRALQGAGIGLTPLAMATVRDALPAEKARPAIATLSLTSAVGVGLGYPVTGLFATYLGLHSGFWFAAVAAAGVLVACALVLPPSPARPSHRLDTPGALLLGLGLGGLLFALSQAERWGWTSPRLLAVGLLAIALLVWWVLHELRTAHPLVDVRLVKERTILATDLTAVLSGVGLYVMMSVVTRYVQTPPSAGYGFGATVVVTGLTLVPFSLASLVSGRVVRVLVRRVPLASLLPLGCVVSLLGTIVFVFARNSLWEMFVLMGVIGLGVGFTISVMPALIVSAVPAHETGSATSFNQVVKYIGYSTGSALSAVVVTSAAGSSSVPPNRDYGVAGVLDCGVWILTALVAWLLVRSHRSGGRTVPAARGGQAREAAVVAAEPVQAAETDTAEPAPPAGELLPEAARRTARQDAPGRPGADR
ncbi:MFS transporter [Streptomyces misionensis]|uniref:MFS transporter n=1 Tax=Streptomyces misionensis TaxID=67331 RepID=UPI00368E7D75